MISQGDIIKRDECSAGYLVVSNNWVNSNLREITVVPVTPIYNPPAESRRTHLVIEIDDIKYLVQCEDILHLHDAGTRYRTMASANSNDMFRVRNRLSWMMGVIDAKSR